MVAIVDKAQHELVSGKPLVAIDTLLDAFLTLEGKEDTSDQKAALLKLFCQAILQSKQVDEARWKDDPVAGLFNNTLSQPTRRFIGICLLRLLARSSACFNSSQFGLRAFALFDEVFVDDVYAWYGITKKEQGFQKQRKLVEVIPLLEQELLSVIHSLSALEMVKTSRYRERFMAVLKSRKIKALIWPFLPESLLEVPLSQAFSLVEEYLRTSEVHPARMFEVFEKTNEMLDGSLIEIEHFATKYSRDYLGGLIKRLKDLLHRHFESNPISKPAQITVMTWEKKYPLSAIGRTFDIGFTIMNLGPGHALDVHIHVQATDVILEKSDEYLGHLDPSSMIVEFPAQVHEVALTALASVEISWTNFDKTQCREEFVFELTGQRSDIDWEQHRKEDPYDLEPVTTEDELVGRQEILHQLIAQTEAKRIGSSYVYGQKRVGKTSIVRTFATRLSALDAPPCLALYLEAGDYVQTDAKRTIEHLGQQLCHRIRDADPSFASLDIPSFDNGALSPLSGFLDAVLRTIPGYRILFILDEFDELPHEIYRKGPIGDAFFLTLRSISAKPSFGFLLVGGEKMEFILSYQGSALNKFDPVRIDYFDREKHWSDFQALVRKPTEQFFEISDVALVALYEQTAGNPYFTKLICRSLFKLLVERRDCYVTEREIEEATGQTLRTVGSNSFQHFWEDGLFDTGTRVEEKSIERRRALVLLAESCDRQKQAQKADILQKAHEHGLQEHDVEAELKDFARRQVLVAEGNSYRCLVPLFGSWLKERGIRDIITTFADLDMALQHKLEEEEAYVRPEEIIHLLKTKDIRYKGRSLSEERIRAWLNQLSNNSERRLMFQILQHLTFYDRDRIRQRLKEAHGMVTRGLVRRIEEKQRKRGDILVSYLDNLGKSGAHYARLYVEENDIYFENVVERGKLRQVLEKRSPQALVFIDDFIGTGKSASKYFALLADECSELLLKTRRVFFIAVCGFEEGRAAAERAITELGLSIEVRLCDPLPTSARCFSDTSSTFPDPEQRERAKQIAYRYGLNIVKEMVSDVDPLGYGGCQATLVFEDSCPNNTLPILWAETSTWDALFKR
jgi:hypothetical protein